MAKDNGGEIEEGYMISIIIPLYNTPIEYFIRCIESILNQSFKDFEIIVVDDGSDLALNKKYETLCSGYQNIFFIAQSNKGVSCARNTGISSATGKYLIFVDGDDKIASCFLRDIHDFVQKYNSPDLITGNIQYVPGEPHPDSNIEIYIENDEVVDFKKAMLGMDQTTFPLPILGTPCGRAYKRRLVENTIFPEGVSHWEDQLFNYDFIDNVKNIVVTSKCWYYYYQNDFSAMHAGIDRKYIEKSIPFWRHWHQRILNEMNPEIRTAMFEKNIDFYYGAIHKSIVPSNKKWRNKKKLLLSLLDEPIFCDTVQALDCRNMKSLKDIIRIIFMKKRMVTMIYLMVAAKVKLHCSRTNTKSGASYDK